MQVKCKVLNMSSLGIAYIVQHLWSTDHMSGNDFLNTATQVIPI